MQVQLQDAFKAYADNTIGRLEEAMHKVNIDGSATDTEPKTVEDAAKVEIDIKGVPLAKSALIAMNSPPAAFAFDAVSAKSLRATPATFAPSCANATAMAWPMPRLAPVTMTTLFLKRAISYKFWQGERPREPSKFDLSYGSSGASPHL